ncbi:uracil-DNA glycosylase [Castellaniella hirudinis]|uniref:Uracil-DNA glycosylase n=2 Tax=Castellaniella TaxID=359336 RepID=A0ABV8RY82_9BURK
MTPRALLRPGQIAWLAEIGLNTHWLATRPEPAADEGAAASMARAPQTAAAVAGPAVAGSAPAAVASTESDAGARAAMDARDAAIAAILPESRAPSASGLTRVRAPAGLVAPQTPAAIAPAACPDLTVLDTAVSACTACARHTQRARAVPGMGQADRPYYLIIGEQPGMEDDASGLPFQGDPGRLLTAMLAAARLPHADSVYLAHGVKCRAVGGHEPTSQDVAACLPWLHRQIALLQPRWILALGRVAARAVIGTDKDLDALRGGPHQYMPDQGAPIPVWVTHQPSSLLVRSAWKAEAWRDLAGLAQAVRAAEKT